MHQLIVRRVFTTGKLTAELSAERFLYVEVATESDQGPLLA